MVEAEKCRSRSSVGQPAQHLIWHAHHTKLHCKMIRMLRNCVSKLSNLKSHLHSIFVEHRRGISIYHGPDAQPKSTDHGSIRSAYLAQHLALSVQAQLAMAIIALLQYTSFSLRSTPSQRQACRWLCASLRLLYTAIAPSRSTRPRQTNHGNTGLRQRYLG